MPKKANNMLDFQIDVLRQSLNFSSPVGLLRHPDLLTSDQQALLRMNLERIELHPDKFGDEDYKVDSSLVAMCDVHNKGKICRCGFPNRKNPSGRCNQRKFCFWCAEVKEGQAKRKFRPFFHRGVWCHATLSWDGLLTVEDWYVDDPLNYWEACSSAVKAVVAEGSVAGAYWAEQLHLEALWPSLLVNAHTHVLFHAWEADAYSSSLEAELGDRMSGYCGPGQVMPRLKPDVLLKPLTHRHYYENVLGYLYHPTKIAHVYVRDWEVSGAARNRSRAQELNANLQGYYDAFTALTFGRHTVHYDGTLDAHRKIYLGRGRGQKSKASRKRQKQDES